MKLIIIGILVIVFGNLLILGFENQSNDALWRSKEYQLVNKHGYIKQNKRHQENHYYFGESYTEEPIVVHEVEVSQDKYNAEQEGKFYYARVQKNPEIWEKGITNCYIIIGLGIIFLFSGGLLMYLNKEI